MNIGWPRWWHAPPCGGCGGGVGGVFREVEVVVFRDDGGSVGVFVVVLVPITKKPIQP